MSVSQISVEQRFALLSAMGANVDWSQLSSEEIQNLIRNPKAMQTTEFLKNGGRLIFEHSSTIQLSKSFNPSEFFASHGYSKDWNVWKGPSDGDGLNGKPEIYEPDDLNEFKVQDLLFEHFLQDDGKLH